jgi:signal transduction histidine kinase
VTGAGRRDEVGTLARSLQVFKDNAIALRTAHRAVEQANAALERRVEERTAELKEAQEELIRRERLSILGQVTATVAHELRNPLATIRNTLYAARQASAAAAVLERPFKRMERALERCDLIIAELLDYTRVRELRSEIAAFDEWLGGVLDEQIPPSGIVLERDFRSGGAALAFDRDRLRRVVINLVDNAAQAITGAETPRAEPRITVRTCLDEEHLELTIEDTGPGIRPEHLPKLFEPLFSTKSSGTGLGLPTVRQIVEQHGGDIRVDSTLGSGTRVIIRLPHGREGGRAAA